MTILIGLIGGGPWAHRVHAPAIHAHRDCTLAGVWTRRQEVAAELAAANHTTAMATVDELLDAVAFAVPPLVQAELASTAARRGKHLILEKPIAADLPTAQRLAEAVGENGVAALVMFTRRFAPETRQWLDGIHRRTDWQGGTATWLSGALLGGEYVNSQWRRDDGAIADIGPHVLDLADAALGTVTGVRAASRSADDLWQVLLEHETGLTTSATMSLRIPVDPSTPRFTTIGAEGISALEGRETSAQDSYAVLLDELTALIRAGETDHPCDVRRGLHIQRLLDMVLRASQ